MTVKEILADLETLGNDTRRKHNVKAGAPENQFGVKLGDLRTVAKKIKIDHALAAKLWETGNVEAQLLATLICKPTAFSLGEIDAMTRSTTCTQVAEWLNSYVVALHPEKETLRVKWMKDKDRWAARAGWHLTASRINKGGGKTDDNAHAKAAPKSTGNVTGKPAAKSTTKTPAKISAKSAGTATATIAADIDAVALLDRIEKELPKAKPEVQWTMNNTLAAIGIKHEEHRARAIAIGEKIGLYSEWPVAKGCTPPYVPVWIAAMVKPRKK